MRRCVECQLLTERIPPNKSICLKCIKKYFPRHFKEELKAYNRKKRELKTEDTSINRTRRVCDLPIAERRQIKAAIPGILKKHGMLNFNDLVYEVGKEFNVTINSESFRATYLKPWLEAEVIHRRPNPIVGKGMVYICADYEAPRTKEVPMIDFTRKRSAIAGRIVTYRRHLQNGTLAPVVRFTHTVDGKPLKVPYEKMMHPSRLIVAPPALTQKMKNAD